MGDVLTSKQRSRCMSHIRGRNTKPELTLRKALWSEGLRYRINSRLPGKPDICFLGLKVAIFVDGCFWHKCPLHFVKPKTREDFWKKKISGNVERDKTNNQKLKELGWTVIRIWEHEIKEDLRGAVDKVIKVIKEKKRSQSV